MSRQGSTPRERAPRADAQRSIAAILDAGEQCLIRTPDASTTEIARAAGVGRVTLYGHFPSRAALVEAVFERVMHRTVMLLDGIDTTGEPTEALRRLIAASWRVVHQFRSILAAAQRELPADRIRGHHQHHVERLTSLLRRGQRDGAFRRDLPLDWLVTVCMTLMHTAAEEVLGGRLQEDESERQVVETVLSACRATDQ